MLLSIQTPSHKSQKDVKLSGLSRYKAVPLFFSHASGMALGMEALG